MMIECLSYWVIFSKVSSFCSSNNFILLEVDHFLQQSSIRDDELVLLRPVSIRLDDRSSWNKSCVVRISNLVLKENKLDLTVKLVTDESLGEALGKCFKMFQLHSPSARSIACPYRISQSYVPINIAMSQLFHPFS